MHSSLRSISTRMIGYILLTVFLSHVFFQSLANAKGGIDSGGGPSHVCRNSSGQITSAETYDLYEGKIWFKLQIPEYSSSVDKQIEEVIRRLSFYYPYESDLKKELANIQATQAFLPANTMIKVGGDLGQSRPIIYENGCELLYAGFYDANGVLQISSPVFNHMTNTQKAAFYVHEALYKIAREHSFVADSEDIRELVAYLFEKSPNSVHIAKLSLELLDWKQSNPDSPKPIPLILQSSLGSDLLVGLRSSTSSNNPLHAYYEYNISCSKNSSGNQFTTLFKGAVTSTQPQNVLIPNIAQCVRIKISIGLNSDIGNLKLMLSQAGVVLFERPNFNHTMNRFSPYEIFPIYMR